MSTSSMRCACAGTFAFRGARFRLTEPRGQPRVCRSHLYNGSVQNPSLPQASETLRDD